MHRLILLTLFTVNMSLFYCTTQAGENIKYQSSEAELKVALLFTLSKFVQWPESADGNNIFICVLGKDPFSGELNSLNGKRARGKNVKIQYYQHSGAYDHCHILFVSTSEFARVENILSITATLPILTISDMDGFARRGGIMNFVTGKKIGFAINPQAAIEKNIKISAPLLELSTLVTRGY